MRSLRFRSLTFLLTLVTLSGFLLIFASSSYYAARQILKDETQAALTQSARAIQHELRAYLRLVDHELFNLTSQEEVQQAVHRQSEAAFIQLIHKDGFADQLRRYQFVLVISVDQSFCYLVKSRLVEIGPLSCQGLYSAYSRAAQSQWSVMRNGSQVLLAKDYLITDEQQKVVGRMVGGIELSDNPLLLSQLVSRTSSSLDKVRLLYTGVAVSELNAGSVRALPESDWLADGRSERFSGVMEGYGDGLSIELTASDDNIYSLGRELLKLLGYGAMLALLVSAAVAAFLSGALDQQLQRLLQYIRRRVEERQAPQWEQGSIKEFNDIGSKMDGLVSELFSSRQALNDMNEQLQMTLEEKRAILHQLIRSQEQERNHLAQELHDELGQLLTAVRVETVLLEHQSAGNEAALKHSAKIKQLVADMYATVYDRIMSLRPTELDELGLAESIRQIPTLDSLRQSGVEVVMQIDEVKVPAGADIHLYRIAQEALTNAMKHALASQVVVSLTQTSAGLQLCISDNGQGVADADPQIEHKGFGLLGIKERCEYIGAQLSLSMQSGVRICVQLPAQAEPLG